MVRPNNLPCTYVYLIGGVFVYRFYVCFVLWIRPCLLFISECTPHHPVVSIVLVMNRRGQSSSATTIVRLFACITCMRPLQCVLQVIGPLYFTHGSAVLEAVFSSFEDWPAPCPGSLCPLPFLGETVMFQVPDIDMPPQVASNYRYHRGVHLCASWSRARVVSLTRTLSGCGSISSGFPISGGSPGSCRKGVGPSPLEDPEDGGGEQEEEEEQQHPVSRRGSTGVGADSAGAGAPADGGGGVKDPPPLSGGGPPRSGNPASADGASICLQGAGRRPSAGAALDDDGAPASSPPHWKNNCGTPTGESIGQEGWGAVQARRTPSPGGGGGGGAFWNGPCGSPGRLTSPGFRLSAGETLGEGGLPLGLRAGGHGRSSFGAGSMASVICESPSEVRGKFCPGWGGMRRPKGGVLLAESLARERRCLFVQC